MWPGQRQEGWKRDQTGKGRGAVHVGLCLRLLVPGCPLSCGHPYALHTGLVSLSPRLRPCPLVVDLVAPASPGLWPTLCLWPQWLVQGWDHDPSKANPSLSLGLLFDHEVTGRVHGTAGGSTHQGTVQEKETDKQRGAERSECSHSDTEPSVLATSDYPPSRSLMS